MNGRECKLQVCLLFNNEEYYIIYHSDEENGIFNQNGNYIGSINQMKVAKCNYLEATYIDNKPYLLLSGENCLKSYEYDGDGEFITYIPKMKNDNTFQIINLFDNNGQKCLIGGDNKGNVVIFDFFSGEEIKSLSFGNNISALCSLNKKYFLVGINDELKVFDYDKKNIKSFKFEYSEGIKKIEKIKIPDKGEFIIILYQNKYFPIRLLEI